MDAPGFHAESTVVASGLRRPEQPAVLERTRRWLREQDCDPRRAPAASATGILLASATPRLHPQFAQRPTLRRRDRRAGTVRTPAAHDELLSILLRVRLPPRSPLTHRFLRGAPAEDTDDRHPNQRRRLQQSAGGAGARLASHRGERARIHNLW